MEAFSYSSSVHLMPLSFSLRHGHLHRHTNCNSLMISCSSSSNGNGGGKRKTVGGVGLPGSSAAAVAVSKYVVPLEKVSPSLIRPLEEILRDLNKRVPDNIINQHTNSIPWRVPCQQNAELLCTRLVWRSTCCLALLMAHREATGTVSSTDFGMEDPVAAAEELAFRRACARFGFGLYLYHQYEAV